MYIINEKNDMTKLCNRYKYNIMFKNFIELFESCCVLVVIFGFAYSMVY